ncbi:hypothetical protein BVJ63_18520 [Vibrio cholerae]|nr:hypothetical protein [Vibrio cholerae]MBO1390501.1 hypothetical protein [Vibrio cholerae]MBO1397955.1 hypothetical protein [Vibrio cholerae]
MVSVVVFEFSVMRCQPLRRALAFQGIVMKNSGLDLFRDNVEVLIDHISENEWIKEIPVLDNVFNMLSLVTSIKDSLFAKKLEQFFVSLNEVSEKDYHKIKQFSKTAEANEISEMIINVLDKVTDNKKPEIIANLFIGYIEEYINLSEFKIALEIVDKSYAADLESFLSCGFSIVDFTLSDLMTNKVYNMIFTPLLARTENPDKTHVEHYSISNLGIAFFDAYNHGVTLRKQS